MIFQKSLLLNRLDIPDCLLLNRLEIPDCLLLNRLDIPDCLLLDRLWFLWGYECSIDRMRGVDNDEDNTVIGMFHYFPDICCHSNLQKQKNIIP
jgi:hypothetical protein